MGYGGDDRGNSARSHATGTDLRQPLCACLRRPEHRPDAVCLRGLTVRAAWDDRLLKWGFWGLNIGLAMMLFLSLLPIGAIQSWAAVAEGLWYARSIEVVHSPLVRTLVWMRVPGDIVFGLGALMIALFVFKLWLGSLGRVPLTKGRAGESPMAAE